MNECTYLLKYKNFPMDKGEIIIPNVDDKTVVQVEIISKYFNYNNYKFSYTCTNCYKIKKLGDTINGLLIEIYKEDNHITSKLTWSVYKK